ncbi:lysozyme family protein [Fictibacillus sp. NRS-1165]|uniref:lysozyme family protein n=1 Tax=Fictibacillus sp. NRS-1165 TaxID=3144463 RepID=UPI003D1C6088
MGYIQAGLFIKKHWKECIIGFLLLMTMGLSLLFTQPEDQGEYTGDGTGGTANVSPLVRRYEPLVAKYAKQFGVEGYTELLLAKMMQESGGRGGDPMQSSESLGMPPNSITDPELSIRAGVYYFSKIIKEAKGDVKISLQSYNFGGGFIDYAFAHGGYSKKVAIDFSHMMAKKMGWSRYGDPNYVDNVLRYLSGGVIAGKPNEYGFVKPINLPLTDEYGMRYHPITGVYKMHRGNDYSCNQKPVPIAAAKAGTIQKAGWQNPFNHRAGYGQRIYIQHDKNLVTVYGHLSKMLVKPGQKVEAGQIIGKCGTTGSSTGMHLHFELHIGGEAVNPTPYVK